MKIVTFEKLKVLIKLVRKSLYDLDKKLNEEVAKQLEDEVARATDADSVLQSNIDDINSKMQDGTTSENKLVNESYVSNALSSVHTHDNKSVLDGLSDSSSVLTYEGSTYATKEYVDDSISTNIAYFRGSFSTKAALDAYAGDLLNNDYAVVLADETNSNETWRYKYNNSHWSAEYRVNETALTSDQSNALNSGATSTLIEKVATDISVTGSGNAVTDVSKSGHTVTFTKGSTYAASSDLSATNSNVTSLTSRVSALENLLNGTSSTAVTIKNLTVNTKLTIPTAAPSSASDGDIWIS